jgi:hypothetical protein
MHGAGPARRSWICLLAGIVICWCVLGAVGVPIPADINAALKKAEPGSIIDVTSLKMDQMNDILNSAAVGHEFSIGGGYLVYSDDPETVRDYGVLYKDSVPMTSGARIYIYHVNGMTKSAKITAVLTNPSTTQNITVSYVRKSLATPSGDYLAVGAEGVLEFYNNAEVPKPHLLSAGSSMLLDGELDSVLVNNEQLLSGIFDISSSYPELPLVVTILMTPTSAVTLDTFSSYGYATKDGYHRLGTYDCNKKLNPSGVAWFSHDVSVGAKYLEIASNVKYTVNDVPLSGFSSYDNSTATLNGNYGVEYILQVAVNNDLQIPVKYSVVLNPRGGEYVGYIRINASATQYIPLVKTSTQGAVSGIIDIPASSATTVTIEFMPAGSTSLPVWLLLLPVV